jgi:hypothetical protein
MSALKKQLETATSDQRLADQEAKAKTAALEDAGKKIKDLESAASQKVNLLRMPKKCYHGQVSNVRGSNVRGSNVRGSNFITSTRGQTTRDQTT